MDYYRMKNMEVDTSMRRTLGQKAHIDTGDTSMISLLISLLIPVAGYVLYGALAARIFGIDPQRAPCRRRRAPTASTI